MSLTGKGFTSIGENPSGNGSCSLAQGRDCSPALDQSWKGLGLIWREKQIKGGDVNGGDHLNVSVGTLSHRLQVEGGSSSSSSRPWSCQSCPKKESGKMFLSCWFQKNGLSPWCLNISLLMVWQKTAGGHVSHAFRGLDSQCTWMMETGLKNK